MHGRLIRRPRPLRLPPGCRGPPEAAKRSPTGPSGPHVAPSPWLLRVVLRFGALGLGGLRRGLQQRARNNSAKTRGQLQRTGGQLPKSSKIRFPLLWSWDGLGGNRVFGVFSCPKPQNTIPAFRSWDGINTSSPIPKV